MSGITLAPPGTILYHCTGPNMSVLMHALCITISSVPSKHSAFCNYFKRGRRGLLRKIPAQSQSISRKPVSITSRPDTKTLAQKTDTYLNILCKPKHSTLYSVSNRFILMLLNTNKTQMERIACVIPPFQRQLQSIVMNSACQAEQRISFSPTSTIPALHIPLTK